MVTPSPETGLLSVLELVGHCCPGRGYRFHILRRWLTVRGARVSAAPSGNVSGVLEISSTGAPKVRRRYAQPLVEFRNACDRSHRSRLYTNSMQNVLTVLQARSYFSRTRGLRVVGYCL